MNLSYIVNALSITTTKVVAPYAASTSSETHTPIKSDGYNSLTLVLGGNTTLRTFNIFLEGRHSSGDWVQIPVYNSNFILQPYICIVDARLSNVGDVLNTYISNIAGFSEIRTRLEYIAGQAFNIQMLLSKSDFSVNKPTTIRDIKGNASIIPRDIEYIGRKLKTTDTGSTDPSLLRPIWLGDVSYCEVVIKNNLNKPIRLSSIMLVNDLNKNLNRPSASFIYDLSLDIAPNAELSVSSVDYPQMVNFGGIGFGISQLNRVSEPATVGSYDFKINVKK